MSTEVDNYGSIGWKPQQPYVISGADYKLYDDDTGYIGMPVELDTAHGTSGVDADDQNKRWVQPYSSAAGTNVCLGVIFQNKPAKGNANERRLGQGGYRRDIALLQFGIIPMLNVGSTTVTMTERVAPLWNATDSLAGFGEWSEGMKILGYCFQAEIPAGHWGWIFVTAEATPAASADVGDLTSVTLDGVADGDILLYDTDHWDDIAHTIANITDTTITGPYADGDILIYDTDAFVDVPLTVELCTDTDITSLDENDILIVDAAGNLVDTPHEVANISDVTETSVASGQTLMWNGSEYVNATLITELLDSPVTTGDDHVFTATGTPLAVVSVKPSDADQAALAEYLYDATAISPTLTYKWSGAEISTNKATDADTHILVTYWYDENA